MREKLRLFWREGLSAATVPIAVEDESDFRNSILKLAPGLLRVEKGGKHLFFNPAIPDWIVVNSNSALLLLSCDGEKSEEGIFASFGLRGSLLADARSLFAEARRRGILSQLGQPEIVATAASTCSSNSNLPTLRSVYLKLTNECNLRCKYCYAGSGKPSEILSHETLREIARQVSEISECVEYVLSGGEPLLNPAALDFAEEAAKAGNQVHLLTNGVLIDESNAMRIAATTKLVKISIDGSTETIHSATRGKGHYEKILRAVDLLDHHGANVMVAMTVTKKNVDDIPAMTARYGSRLMFQPLFIAGRGKKRGDIALTGEEYFLALDSAEGVAPMGNIAGVLESLRGRGFRRCVLADREISISESGDVYPCQLLHSPEFKAGNIYETNLRDIYLDSQVLKKLRTVNVETIAECSKCPIRLVCAGGCRARDFYECGSIEEVGEFCEYEKLAFINGMLDYSVFGE